MVWEATIVFEIRQFLKGSFETFGIIHACLGDVLFQEACSRDNLVTGFNKIKEKYVSRIAVRNKTFLDMLLQQHDNNDITFIQCVFVSFSYVMCWWLSK